VLTNTFLIFTFAFGMGWTYIVMLVSQVLQDLGLALTDWGALWSAIALAIMTWGVATTDEKGEVEG
jgi:hypothetical protein